MLTMLRRRAVLRGPLGGSRQWTILWAALVGVRLLRRFTRGKDEVVLCEELRPGETMVLASVDREPRILDGTPGKARRG